MKLQIKTTSDKAQLPEYQSSGASGFDLHSIEDVIIDRDCTVTVDTGLQVAVPEGYEMQIRPRSGLSLNTKLRVANSPGTIDSDYRGNIKIIIHNAGNKAEQIQEGDRIAQGVICPIIQCELEQAEELDETTRGEDGLGSTGKS